MPEAKTLNRAKKDKAEGKSPSTQAGEFIREEIHHVREGKHGARSAKQAIAIGLSKARRAGVKLAPPESGSTSGEVRLRAKRDTAAGKSPEPVSKTRSKATSHALKKEGQSAASPRALARQARSSAQKKSPEERSVSARKAAHTRAGTRKRAAAA